MQKQTAMTSLEYLDECGNCGGNDTLGCTDSAACNYDMDADCDDNSCVYGCDSRRGRLLRIRRNVGMTAAKEADSQVN